MSHKWIPFVRNVWKSEFCVDCSNDTRICCACKCDTEGGTKTDDVGEEGAEEIFGPKKGRGDRGVEKAI